MNLLLFLKGAAIGFSIAAPVGPIGILCIRRTLQYGRFSGLFSGFGAATADTMYGLVATLSLTLVSDFFITHKFWLRFIGGLFLLCLGARTFFIQAEDMGTTRVSHKTLVADFVSTFFLTLSNPITILSFVAIFAGLGLVNISKTYFEAGFLLLGIFLGSSCWWLILSEGVTFFRKKVSKPVMLWINRSAGLMIVTFGLAALISLLH